MRPERERGLCSYGVISTKTAADRWRREGDLPSLQGGEAHVYLHRRRWAVLGSEGKGLIVGHIARQYGHHVRVGAANAGHTLYTSRSADVMAMEGMPGDPVWEKHVMQQIPCAAYANPDAKLWIGPGALISPDIFAKELDRWTAWREGNGLPPMKVVVDPRAHVILDEHIQREQESGLAERIGSTSTIAREGIGAAQAARVMREAGCVLASEWLQHWPSVEIRDVASALRSTSRGSRGVLCEGTQGTGLSLTTGYFPFVTSRNTTAAGLLADCGLPPRQDRCILVCRTYPIRVAGPSGPFHEDSQEISWKDIGIDPESERTTVTKKVRRVATLSLKQIWEAAHINGATEIALTFADYLEPGVAGLSGKVVNEHADVPTDGPVWKLVTEIERDIGIHVKYIGTGPHSVIERQLATGPVNPLALQGA